MKIAVIGTGNVGLVTGTCLAESGNDVVCVDQVAEKIARLKQGMMPIYEPGLGELVHRNSPRRPAPVHHQPARGNRRRRAGVHRRGDAPGRARRGRPARRSGRSDARSRSTSTSPRSIVIKSTVPVGTNAELARRMAAATDVPFDVANNPEFLKEGAAIDDFNKPDRVVVGVRRAEVAERLHDLYGPFLRTDRPFLVMTPESAEMTKYVANCLLATKISFINEMANLCEAYGADINEVRRGIGHDQRIGFSFLFPGVGYGGSCFPRTSAP